MASIVDLLGQILPSDKIKASIIDRYAFAGDAGFYYLLPQAIVQPDHVDEIKRLFNFARGNKIPLTFRAAGTSLSGQSITDGILVDLSRHWKNIQALEDGNLVQVQPSAIGAHVNHLLKKNARKIGPDPASISAAMMGGILSNNSSGMCCGVIHNSYHTLKSIHFVLPNGNEYNTSINADYDRFRDNDKDIFEGLKKLRESVLSNEKLIDKIRRKYKIKNTVGYCINAFGDY